MAKRRTSRKGASRRTRSNIKIEMSGNLSRKDREDLRKFKWKMKESMRRGGCGSAIYGLGFLGALVYYITTATSVWAAILGVFKALLWPAFLVYSAMMSLGM